MKQVNGLEISSFRPLWRNLLNLISITWYKDLSISLRYSRGDEHLLESVNDRGVEESIGKLLFIAQIFVSKPGSSGSDFSSELADNGTAVPERLLNVHFQKKNTP